MPSLFLGRHHCSFFMDEKEKKYADLIFSDVITGSIHRFIVAGKDFYFYPVTMAMSFRLSPVIASLQINDRVLQINPYLEIYRLAVKKKEECCTLLSLYTTPNNKTNFFDKKEQRNRKDFFYKHLSTEAIAMLTTFAITSDKTDLIIKHLGIDKEREKMKKIMEVKEKTVSNSVTVGGKSIFGTFLAQLKSFGYSDTEILYERPYSYLRLMIEDKPDSIYLTDEELQTLPKEFGGTLLVADNVDNKEDIIEMLKEKGLTIDG